MDRDVMDSHMGFDDVDRHDNLHWLRTQRQLPIATPTPRVPPIGPSFMQESSGFNTVGFGTPRDNSRNYNLPPQHGIVPRDAQNVVDYLKRMRTENPNFFYAIQDDDDQGMSNVFWADQRARTAYNYFGDAVTFDTSYRTNRSRIPFATFTGVNHHRQPVLFGCALLPDESEFSFVWLFKTWLSAMSGRHPISITTDQDRALRAAIAQVFPETRHRFCKWHVLRETQERLSHVYLANPGFQGDFDKCVNGTESVDEFESYWGSLVDQYDLRDNEWIISLYNSRRQWVPVYLRDTFFAEMFTTQGSEGVGSFFDGYVNSKTNLQVFVTQYEKALDSRYEKEVKADSETMNSAAVLKTPSPMEKQAAELYTKKIFSEFQDELVEILAYSAKKIDGDGVISTYRVAKFGGDQNAYNVTFNSSEMRATCSCQMFEFSGILCRHVLTVFRVRNVLTIPSHYILKRWTREAKSGVVLDDRGIELEGNPRESLTMQYNNLRQEAIKYAKEGAASIDIYNVAMYALREAVGKVTAAKKSAVEIVEMGAFIGGNHRDNNISGMAQAHNMVHQITHHHDPHQNMGGIHPWALLQPRSQPSQDEKEKRVQELKFELERVNRQCEAYRAHLLMFLKDIGEHEQNLSKKVRIREIESEEPESIEQANG
eukprot:TRINITY_DN2653_c0_g1_i1.p1 TRINITY_DN2653_c0_g1~~TRINITY_DN2653_c0_g1_i1.p1  ORF type:complete len:655 (-),score=74.16 TRINITY_DN2653_c0_g1_i1:26-1990(-)